VGVYQTVVVGTDGSETSLRAVDHAGQMAAASDAKLIIATAYLPDTGRFVSALLRDARARAKAAGATKIEVRSIRGYPVKTLVNLVEEVDADLLVVGNVGFDTLLGQLSGSVAGDVTWWVKSDVLIVETAAGLAETTWGTTRGTQWRLRVGAFVLVALMAAAALFTYLAYTAAFTPTKTVTVEAERAGLVMDRDAKVKYLGVAVGSVKRVAYDGDHARLTLAIGSDQIGRIPSNAAVRIAANTVFGAKSVEFMLPDNPSAVPLSPGAHVWASSVSVEVNTLFETLINVLQKIDPVELNATLSAISEGLRDNGDNIGAMLVDLNEYLPKLNPELPTVHSDVQKTAVVADIYGDAAPNLMTVIGEVPAISHTVVSQKDELTATLLATTGLADTGFQTLSPAAEDFIAAIQRLRAPLKVLGDYSPELGCLITGLGTAYKQFGPYWGGYVPGLFLEASLIPGSPAYTYPESLPVVNASGGPNCRGLPHVPGKVSSGSHYKVPFLVTDNAYVPYQPNTELTFDPPSTLQYLFNGAFAERDAY
jgi:phospholipid/cholesterol/gamma-HCH transport system substrate-binding protein